MEEFFVGQAVSAILLSIKNSGKKARLRSALLKVFKAIKAQYADDPDFA